MVRTFILPSKKILFTLTSTLPLATSSPKDTYDVTGGKSNNNDDGDDEISEELTP